MVVCSSCILSFRSYNILCVADVSPVCPLLCFLLILSRVKSEYPLSLCIQCSVLFLNHVISRLVFLVFYTIANTCVRSLARCSNDVFRNFLLPELLLSGVIFIVLMLVMLLQLLLLHGVAVGFGLFFVTHCICFRRVLLLCVCGGCISRFAIRCSRIRLCLTGFVSGR